MTAGISVANANAMLESLGDVYIQLHIGDPGADGSSNVADLTVRELADLGSASNAVRSLVTPVEWASGPWSGPAQTVTHVSGWSEATEGTFIFSAALSSHIDFAEGRRPRLTVLAVSIPSIAAD